MTNFEKFKAMDVECLATWLDQNGIIDNSPWMLHFNDKYCANCESIMCKLEDFEEILGFKPMFFGRDVECAYCEVYNKCRYLEDMDRVPNGVEVVKLWLESEAE